MCRFGALTPLYFTEWRDFFKWKNEKDDNINKVYNLCELITSKKCWSKHYRKRDILFILNAWSWYPIKTLLNLSIMLALFILVILAGYDRTS